MINNGILHRYSLVLSSVLTSWPAPQHLHLELSEAFAGPGGNRRLTQVSPERNVSQ